jgi:hypothetical protein
VSRRGRAARVSCLLVALALLSSACRKDPPNGETRTTPGSTSTKDAASSGTALVAQPKHDFGHVTQGDTLRHAFTTRNAAATALSVEDTMEVLGCAGVAAPRVLDPGGSGKLEVTCRADVPGPLRVSLPLRANGRPARELSHAAVVEPLLAFERSVVELTVPFGEERGVEVRLWGKRAKQARLSAAALPPPSLDASVLRGDAGRAEGVRVHAVGKAVGTHVGSLRYATGLAAPPEVSLSYVVKVTGTLTVSPTNPVLELGGAGPKRVVVKVTSTRPGFVVSRAEVLDGPFTARVRRGDDGYDVELTAVEAKLPAGARGVNGRVRILSNDRTEAAKEVPVLALGAPSAETPGR